MKDFAKSVRKGFELPERGDTAQCLRSVGFMALGIVGHYLTLLGKEVGLHPRVPITRVEQPWAASHFALWGL